MFENNLTVNEVASEYSNKKFFLHSFLLCYNINYPFSTTTNNSKDNPTSQPLLPMQQGQ